MAEPLAVDPNAVVLDTPATVPRTTSYDPLRARERLRGVIAIVLLIILTGVIAGSFAVVFIVQVADNKDKFTVFEKVLTIVFGPLVALVSAATGFYFGSRSEQT